MERDPEELWIDAEEDPTPPALNGDDEPTWGDFFEKEPEQVDIEPPKKLTLDPEMLERITRRSRREPDEIYIARVQPPEEQEEIPSGPTCKHFAPAAGLVDALHADVGEDWPYDTLFGEHGCGHPQRNRQGRLACDAYMCMPACQYYEEETGTLLHGKQSDEVKVLLRKRRAGLGIPNYDVVKVHETTEEIVASFDNHVEEGNAKANATQAYEKEITKQNLSGAADIDVGTFEIPSYLKMLVAEHA